MGGSRWSNDDWSSYSASSSASIGSARSRGLSDADARKEFFKQSSIKDYLDPRNIKVRESRDSAENPNSRAIIVGLDVTGSMGMIAEHMATKSLGRLFGLIYDLAPVADPHIMLMAIGDITSDRAPLQVSQFEADIRIGQQLADIWLEGRGGGNDYESYDLPWYFAARRTSIDCWEKRNEKGYIFTIGDELPPRGKIQKTALKEYFNMDEQEDMSPTQMLKEAQEKYDVFHIIVEEGNFASRQKKRVVREWTDILGKRAIPLNNYEYLAEVIMSVIGVNEGADPQEVIAQWQVPEVRAAVTHALGL